MSMDIENHQLLTIGKLKLLFRFTNHSLGFTDGFLHIYDKRLHPQDSLVMEVRDTRSPVSLNLFTQKTRKEIQILIRFSTGCRGSRKRKTSDNFLDS